MEQKLYDAAANLPETNLTFDAIQPAPKKRASAAKWRTAVALAACFALLLVAGFGVYAEAREYNNAITFFNNYGLSTEGLARGEIKAVYRDITTKSFTYSKTAEVIQKSLSGVVVDGYEIFQEKPTPEELEDLWNLMHNDGDLTLHYQTGIRYRYRNTYKEGKEEITCLEKYDGETLLWSTPVHIPVEFVYRGYSVVSDGVIAYGGKDRARIVKLDEDGNICWQHIRNNDFMSEHIEAVLENDDGSYAVFSKGDYRYLCLSQYSRDGEELSVHKTEIGSYSICNGVCFDDGYIVQLGSHRIADDAKLVKVDRAGNITEYFTYDAEDANYYINDMIEFNGNIYLSAYATPKPEGEESAYGGRSEIARILDYVFSRDAFNISDEELTPIVRDNYTAVLLVCDPKSGIPKEFYSVASSLGGGLSVSDGQLYWDAGNILTATYYSKFSAYSVVMTCQIYRYTFDGAGVLISQQNTGEIGYRAR